jgi:hypothetical protein
MSTIVLEHLQHANSTSPDLTVGPGGEIGIGTTSPDFPLVVQASSGGNTLKLIGRTSDSISGLSFSNAGNTASNYIQGNSSYIRARADGGVHFRSGGTPVTTDTDGFTIQNLNVGIGTDSPLSQLDIRGSITIGPVGQTYAVAEIAPGSAAVGQFTTFKAYNSNSLQLQTFNSNTAAYNTGIVLDTIGNVGIGTAAPASKLHIKASNSGYTGGIQIEDADSSTKSAITHVNGNLYISSNTTSDHIIIEASGDVGMGAAPYTNAKLTLGGTTASYNATLMFDNNTGGGAEFFMLASDNTWSAGANKFLMGHGAPSSSAADMTIDADGNVGIGTYNPSEKLEVSGNIKLTGQVEGKLAPTTAATLTATLTATSKNAILAAGSGFIDWQTKVASNTSWFSISGNNLTILKSGLVTLTINQDVVTAPATGYCSCEIRINNGQASIQLITNTNTQWDCIHNSWCGYLSVNDYISVRYTGNFTAMDVGSWSNYNLLWIAQ